MCTPHFSASTPTHWSSLFHTHTHYIPIPWTYTHDPKSRMTKLSILKDSSFHPVKLSFISSLSSPFSLLLFAFLFLSQSSHHKNTPLPSFFLPFLLLLLQVCLTLTYTVTSLSSPPPISPPQQFPAPRYRQSLLSLGNTLLVLSRKQPREPNSKRSC